jgi:hypothetical protein
VKLAAGGLAILLTLGAFAGFGILEQSPLLRDARADVGDPLDKPIREALSQNGVDPDEGCLLLWLFRPGCESCRENTPLIADLAQTVPDIFVVGLTDADKKRIKGFKETFNTPFPLFRIDSDRMIGLETSLPMNLLVCDGHVKKIWKRETPDPDEIMKLFED